MGTYNGWANRETWLVNAWMGDNLVQVAQDLTEAVGRGIPGPEVKGLVLEDIEQKLVAAGLLVDLLHTTLNRVDWEAIAAHVNDEAEG